MLHSSTNIFKYTLILLIPILIITTAVGILATDGFLAFEYGKSSFPPDPYGFSQRERYELASYNVHYVRGHLADNALSTQMLNGVPIYNPRELSHMLDVQAVFRAILSTGQVAFILLVLIGFILWQNGEKRALGAAIRSGGLLTSGFILFIGLLAIFAWQFWFEAFHLLFFKPGSWLFSYTDTLIRLFPVEFWFDATLTISLLSLLGGLFMAAIGQRIAIEKVTQI